MIWQSTPYQGPLFAQGILALVMAVVCWRRRPASGAVLTAALLVCTAWWSIANLIEKGLVTFPAKFFWASAQYPAFTLMPVIWFLLGLTYTGRDHFLTPARIVGLMAPAALVTALAFADPWLNLVRTHLEIEWTGTHWRLAVGHGPAFWLYVAYSYPLLAMGCAMMVQALFGAAPIFRLQAASMLVSVMVPWAANAIYLSGQSPVLADLTPLTLWVAILSLSLCLFVFRVFDVVPIARDSVMEMMPDAIVVLDGQKRVVDLNPSAARMLGLSLVAHVGHPMPEGLREAFERHGPILGPDDQHYRMILGGGDRQRIYSVHVSGLPKTRRPREGRIIVLRDITDLTRAEESQRESSARLHAAFESAPFDMWVSDTSGRIVQQNSAAMRQWGHFVGCLPEEMSLAPSMIEKCRRDNDRALAGMTIQEETHYIIDGQKKYFHTIVTPIRDGQRIRGTLGINMDVTPLKHAEQQARESENRYRLILEQASDGVFLADADARLVEVNHAALHLLGYERDELLQKTILEVHAPEERPHLPDRLAALRAGKTIRATRRLLHKDGHAIVTEISAKMLDDGRMLALVRDVSERRAIEERIQKTQKLESLAVLAGGIAHDFNNLLVGVLGNAGLALLELEQDSPAYAHIDCVQTAALRAAELCQQLLAYSGMGTFVIQPIDLSSLAREMTHLLEVLISKKAVLTCDLASNLPTIDGDATQIRQIVMNLITNALESISHSHGEIRLHAGVRTFTKDELRFAYLNDELAPGAYVVLEVADNGSGIDAGTRGRIFDPFFTTKFTGRGLGLAAVLGIVRGHNGGILLDSEPGVGSTFTLLFPPGAGVKPPSNGTAVVPASFKGSGAVLVVDDEDYVVMVASATLRHAGFEVLTARDGAEAIEQLRGNLDRIAAVLLDATMPRMDGAQATMAMRALRPELPIILSSGYRQQDACDHFNGHPPDAFLQKPYRPIDLIDKVRQVLDQRVATGSVHG